MEMETGTMGGATMYIRKGCGQKTGTEAASGQKMGTEGASGQKTGTDSPEAQQLEYESQPMQWRT